MSIDFAIKASGGFIVSEGQHNEFMAGRRAERRLRVLCHNPHQPAQFGITTECSNCHASQASAYAGTLMDKVGVVCEDCHMPPATLSAQALGPKTGDMKTHIFYINTDPGANMIANNGANVALTGGKGAVTLDFACQRCHQGASLNELARFANDFHNPNKSLEGFGLDGGLTGTWWNAARSGEGFVLQFGYVPGTTNLTLFASFYTYDNMGNQAWLVALADAALERHAILSREVQEMGVKYLRENGVGGARNAIQLVIEGLRIEKESVGAPRISQKLLDMSDEQLLGELEKYVTSSKIVDMQPIEVGNSE